MTIMPMDNHPLTHRRLQFIRISVNKLMLKSIKIIQFVKQLQHCKQFYLLEPKHSSYENPGYLV